jgi:hypothetical protein
MHDSCRFDPCRCPLSVRLSTMLKHPQKPGRTQTAVVGCNFQIESSSRNHHSASRPARLPVV